MNLVMPLIEMLSVGDAATAFVVAGVFVAFAVPIVRVLARRVGAVDHPGGRRTHLESVPRLGGVAVISGILAGLTVVVGRLDATGGILDTTTRLAWLGVGATALGLLAVGIRDDLAHIRAGVKLGLELAAGAVLYLLFPVESVDLGLFQVPGSVAFVSAGIVMLWVATVTNAYNMVDGLDGLAAGVGAIAAAALAVGAWLEGNGAPALALVAVSGALTGFLVHNRHPARIFLGDAGSLPIGFLLAALGYVGFRGGTTWFAVPAVIALALPLLDLFVSVVRRFFDAVRVTRQDELRERFELSLRKAPGLFTPDDRHIHHRLLRLGLSRRWTVVSLYGLAFAFALLSLATDRWRDAAPVAFVMFVSVLGFLGSRWLYRELRVLRRGVLLPLFETRAARNRWVHAAFDVVAVGLAFAAARQLMVWDWGASVAEGDLLVRAAAAGGTAAAILWLTGIYRFSFRRVGQWALSRTTLAIGFAMLGAASVDTLLFGETLHWSSWLLTGFFSLVLVLAPRLSYRVLDSIHQRARSVGRRVLIFGAGRGGGVTLRELLENRQVGMIPIGFVDDDPGLWGRLVEGFEIFPGGQRFADTLSALDVDAVLVSSRKVPGDRLVGVIEACEAEDVEVRRVAIAMGEEEPMARILEPIAGVIRPLEEPVESARAAP